MQLLPQARFAVALSIWWLHSVQGVRLNGIEVDQVVESALAKEDPATLAEDVSAKGGQKSIGMEPAVKASGGVIEGDTATGEEGTSSEAARVELTGEALPKTKEEEVLPDEEKPNIETIQSNDTDEDDGEVEEDDDENGDEEFSTEQASEDTDIAKEAGTREGEKTPAETVATTNRDSAPVEIVTDEGTTKGEETSAEQIAAETIATTKRDSTGASDTLDGDDSESDEDEDIPVEEEVVESDAGGKMPVVESKPEENPADAPAPASAPGPRQEEMVDPDGDEGDEEDGGEDEDGSEEQDGDDEEDDNEEDGDEEHDAAVDEGGDEEEVGTEEKDVVDKGLGPDELRLPQEDGAEEEGDEQLDDEEPAMTPFMEKLEEKLKEEGRDIPEALTTLKAMAGEGSDEEIGRALKESLGLEASDEDIAKIKELMHKGGMMGGFKLLGFGQCQVASGNTGDRIELADAAEADCKTACAQSSDCLAFDYGAENRVCELHGSIMHETTADQAYRCFVKVEEEAIVPKTRAEAERAKVEDQEEDTTETTTATTVSTTGADTMHTMDADSTSESAEEEDAPDKEYAGPMCCLCGGAKAGLSGWSASGGCSACGPEVEKKMPSEEACRDKFVDKMPEMPASCPADLSEGKKKSCACKSFCRVDFGIA